jgi:EAL domain-containing protein (putative c-di-GMP-specific phosphodiesterase class I)
LRDIGVGVAFDDFGTGYASLSLLKHYPLTRIKIDRSFVQQIAESRQDEALVRAIVDIARNFDLEVIAEGVETEAQRDILLQYDCMEAQGYLFGRPESADSFTLQHVVPN